MAKKRLIIVDAFALIFRAFYAFISNPLRTSSGTPTSAIFGFLRMIMKVIKDLKPDYLAVAFESEEKTFREKLYPEYKANRQEPPDDLKTQIPILIEILKAFNFPLLSLSGYEADDVIATIVNRLNDKNDIEIFILTSDKDLMQLVSDNVKCVTSSKGITDILILDKEGVKEKYGVYPDKIFEFLALTGDNADNIPGIKGIGPKTAIKLLEDFGSIDEMLKHIDRIKGKIKENVSRGHKDIELSKKLLELKTDIDIEVRLEKFNLPDFKSENGINFLKKYELTSLLKDPLFTGQETDERNIKKNENIKQYKSKEFAASNSTNNIDVGEYKLITKKEELDQIINDAIQKKYVSIDTETTSEIPLKAELIGISLCSEEKKAYFIPFAHNIDKDYDNDYALMKMRKLTNTAYLIGQNIKYDYLVLKKYNVDFSNIYFDTMVASYVLNPSREKNNLDYLSKVFLNYTTVKYTDLVNPKKGETLLDVDIDRVVNYACEDADITFRLYNIFNDELKKNKLEEVFFNIDMPLVKIISEMEYSGVLIDEKRMGEMSLDFQNRLSVLETSILKTAGYDFNVNSTQQLAKLLFEDLKLSKVKKTKTGFSTDNEVLEELIDAHPVIKKIIEYRKLSKIKNTYLDAIPPLVNDVTKRVHASFNLTITATGRLSSSNPNLQNIPIRGEIGSDVRQCFIASAGSTLISADYSQIELRILAHVTDDDLLISTFRNNGDIHAQTASLIYNHSIEKITSEMRANAKTINFAVIYGRGARNLSKDLKISIDEASKFRNTYFEKYRGVTEYVDFVKNKSSQSGFVKTLFGRIRYLPGFDSESNRDIAQAERIAFNTIIQGTSADIIKLAMKNIFNRLQKENLSAKLIIQVHDELVFEADNNETEQTIKIIKEEMEKVCELKVPLIVNINKGKNWDEAHG